MKGSRSLVEPTRQNDICISYELVQNQNKLTYFTFDKKWEVSQKWKPILT